MNQVFHWMVIWLYLTKGNIRLIPIKIKENNYYFTITFMTSKKVNIYYYTINLSLKTYEKIE